MATSFFLKKNNAKSTLASTLSAGATSATIATGDGTLFPSSNFVATIWDATTYPDPGDDPNMEIVLCSSRSDETLTISRAQESTADVEHASGSAVRLLLTKGQMDEYETAVNALENLTHNAKAYTTGDIFYASGATTTAELAIGTSSQVLGVSGGLPAWLQISNTHVADAAAIAYSKLDLDDSIVNADVSASAAISASKLNIDTDSFSAGDVLTPKFIGARAYRSADQTGILPSTDTHVLLDSETYDTGSDYDSATLRAFTAPVAGYYRISARVTFQSTEDAKIYRARIWNGTIGSGTLLDEAVNTSGVASSLLSCDIVSTHHLAAADVIRLGCFHNQAGNGEIDGGNNTKTFMEIVLVAKDV